MAKIDLKKEQKRVFKKILSRSGINAPWPENLDKLKHLSPIIVPWHYEIDYIHSYGELSPFFLGIKHGKLLGTSCSTCGYKYATPRLHCMYCGGECQWFELSPIGKIHSFTVCYFGSEEFLDQVPYILIMVEWDGVDTLFLSRIKGLDPNRPSLSWIGLAVKPVFARGPKRGDKVSDVWFIPV